MCYAETSEEHQRECWHQQEVRKEVVCRVCECWDEACKAQPRHLHVADTQQVHPIRIDPRGPHVIHRCSHLNKNQQHLRTTSKNIRHIEIHAETPLGYLESACVGYARKNHLQPLKGFGESTRDDDYHNKAGQEEDRDGGDDGNVDAR